jgi:hypothetical protein
MSPSSSRFADDFVVRILSSGSHEVAIFTVLFPSSRSGIPEKKEHIEKHTKKTMIQIL